MKKQLRIINNYSYHIITKFLTNFIKLIIRPIRFYPINWSFNKHIIIETPTDPSLINQYFSEENNINYKIYGVNWDHSSTLEEITTTMDINQFDRYFNF